MDKRIRDFLKKKNNIAIVVILIIGIVLLMMPAKGTEKSAESETVINDEERLEEMLSSIKGVSAAKVMITYSSSEEKRLAYEIKTGKTDRGEAGYEEDMDKAAIMANGEPVILSRAYPGVKGVVVIAEGASEKKAEIMEAVTTAFDIPRSKVCILEK